MCGILGYFLHQVAEPGDDRLVRGLHLMSHRGPDDEGLTLIDPDRGTFQDVPTDDTAKGVRLRHDRGPSPAIPHRIGFGHRRFSIIDLSPSGHQPMWTSDGSVCVSVNGEVYNYRELRKELADEGFSFQSGSDSEVLAAAYRSWGVGCFQRFNGFYAASIYDATSRCVVLARDRLGKAPLYVSHSPHGVFWASEINVLRWIIGDHNLTVNELSVVNFVTWQRKDIAHTTFFNEIHSIPNATFVLISNSGMIEETRYWSVPTTRIDSSCVSTDEAATELRALLDDATKLRLRADVPVAVQLSGGMDSSVVLALASRHAPRVSAFTVSFPGTDWDEEPYARQVAQLYSGIVDYNVIRPPDDDLIVAADDYIYLMGEPFHSPNQFTANRVWRTIAGAGFRVNLYGTGGDEVFAGYPSEYFFEFVRSLISKGRIGRAARELATFSERKPGFFGSDVALRLLRTSPMAYRMYKRFIRTIPASQDPLIVPPGIKCHQGPSHRIEVKMIELVSDFLMSYWLRVDNQNSMSIPLELRTPFLDYRVVDYAFSLPLEYLIRDGWMKWILRCAATGLLPPGIVWRRKKMGFPFPLDTWLDRHRGRLLDMVQPLDCPYLDLKKLSGGFEYLRRRNPPHLWCLISLALWWKRCIQGDRLR